MANKKISDLTAKGANLEATDLFEIAEDAGGGTYVAKSITGAEIKQGSINSLFYANLAAFPVTGAVDNFYIDKATEAVYVWDGATYSQVNAPTTDTNFANTDLSGAKAFTANRTHDLVGYKATFDNAELKVIADANTSGDVPFEVTQADGTTSIFKVTGDKAINTTGDITQTTAGNTSHTLAGAQCFIYMNTTLTSGNFTADNFGNFYVQNTANNGYLHLRTTGSAGTIDVSSTGIIRVLSGLPVYADEAAAVTGGLAQHALYKTATGEIRIKL